MNKAKLKTYAPQARKDFIAAVTARAHRIGLAEKNGSVAIAPAEKNGDFVIIAGQSWPAKISRQRDNLIARIDKEGFSQTMEAVAYTWFNRFAALRYMEIHDYLNHGYRVLSSREGGLPEILNAAPELAQKRELPDLNPQQVIELKLAGDQDGELYRLTLIAQCNALSSVMPFLFERIDNETELLLPDNLLLTDSVIAKLVGAIPEEDWQQVEIIGWLYQFYISEKKDQVIGKVVKSEDIPAATQLFTPNWIVQYLVQNSLGRLWTMANPASTLKSQWPYYIEPAEQTDEVGAALAALTQTRIDEDGGSLNPETITVLDPACGSGHILVEAYDVLKAIYLERGYQLRSIPRLILEKNLFGLDIDDRAAQLAGFALLMKARADNRRLLDNPPKLNVLALQESKGLDVDELTQILSGYAALTHSTIAPLIDTFAHAKTFGSLIQIPQDLNAQLATMDADLQLAIQSGDLFAQATALNVLPLVRQAQILGMQFDAVVANPPYMGNKYFVETLRKLAEDNYPRSKTDTFCMFIERSSSQLKLGGFAALVTIQNWMFLSSFEAFRQEFLRKYLITSLVQIGYNSFPEINSKVAQASAFCFQNTAPTRANSVYINLNSAQFSADKQSLFLDKNDSMIFLVCQKDFLALDGAPVAYNLGARILKILSNVTKVQDLADPREGINTGDNDRFMRFWSEISLEQLSVPNSEHADYRVTSRNKTWFPCNKGGAYRRWYGNNDFVVNWSNDGLEIRNLRNVGGALLSRPQNTGYFFREGVTWSGLGQLGFSGRYFPNGFAFNSAGRSAFPNGASIFTLLGALNSNLSNEILKVLAPTLSFTVGNIGRLPFDKRLGNSADRCVKEMIDLAKLDWDSSENSWDFKCFALLIPDLKCRSSEESWAQWQTHCDDVIGRMKALEEENNRIFIEAYGLQDELSPEVPEAQITLVRADREKDSQRLISYAIGCMMGRYSPDEPGLIYAHAGNAGFDPARYKIFPADTDGIVPITDELWFEDDAANRIREFLLAMWNAETLDENIAWLAESLGQRSNETPIETIRRYIASSFFKDHLQTYKKRPIYWLFSSGKQGAFQALVYLHRYHESTLARMRAEYVVPLTGKIQSRIEMLEKDAAVANSNATRSKLNKDIEKLKKKHVELLAYDEKLRHYADQRIQLDLDDGVKVNYGKFGDLLAEVKAVTGGAGDD
jgi:type II restriction/modification system DNA methylase subunit YeeA